MSLTAPTAPAPRAPRNLFKLPAGQTCAHCYFFARCQQLFPCDPQSTECDTAPHSFVPKLPGKAAD